MLSDASLGHAPTSRAGRFRRAAKGFVTILAWWGNCRSRARERRALAQLSDWGLRDIGLTRAEAEGESRKASWHRWQRPVSS